MSDITIVLVVLVGAVGLFAWNRLPVEVVAVGSALALVASGVLDVEQGLAGFGDQTVIFIATLFVVSTALDSTGVTAWAGQQLIRLAGDDPRRLLVATMLLSAVLTAVISVNGAVAALIPMVVVMALRLSLPTSRLMMPLAFSAHAGSMLALTGTPVNVLVSDALEDAGGGRFGYLEFALVGVPLLVTVVVITMAFGSRLLPDRTPSSLPPDLSEHAQTLAAAYEIDDDLVGRQTGVVEVVIPPRSAMVGQQAFPGMVTDSGDLVVLAVHRGGEDCGPGTVTLRAGDALLVQGRWGDLEREVEADREVMAVHRPEVLRAQSVPLGLRSTEAIAITAGMVVLLATGVVPAAVAGLLAAGAVLALGVLSPAQAYHGVSWSTVLLVAGMIPMSTALQVSGAADEAADALVRATGDAGPRVLLLGIFLLTAVIGSVISNTATALIVIPIAVSAAADLGVAPAPVLMAVTVSASAAFLLPITTPANLMVMGPGGYRFTDYWKLGLPLLVAYGAIVVGYIPLVWGF